MKLQIRLVLTTALLLMLLACDKPQNKIKIIKGSWKVAEKEVAIGNTKHIYLYTIGELYIDTGKTPELRVEADDNLLPYLITREVDGKLDIMTERDVKIGFDPIIIPPTNDIELCQFSRIVNFHLIPRRRIKYYLTLPNLEGITSWNNANVTVKDLEGEKFLISSSF